MSRPTLALCIPAYNAAWCLPRLLGSAQKQTIPFDEILVYDDCSSDETSKIAELYGARVIRGEINVGCSIGKNTLAQVTSCDWIHFHDADDELLPNFVEAARRWMLMKDRAPDVVLFGYEWRDGLTNELLGVQRFDDYPLKLDPVSYTIWKQINPFCGIYKKDSILSCGGYDCDSEVLYNEDVAFHCRLARCNLKFAADPTITVINYRYNNSMSQSNSIKCIRAHIAVLIKAAKNTDRQYHSLIAEKLWAAAGVAGSYLAWDVANEAVSFAVRLGARHPYKGKKWFNLMSQLSPHVALRVREHAIRLIKPKYRKDN